MIKTLTVTETWCMKKLFPLILIFLISMSCNQEKEVDLEQARRAILKLHNAQRDYHFNKDSIGFASQFSDNFKGIGNGSISSSTKEERISRYNRYFSAVEFIKWDDVSEPIIRFSDDATMAYALVDKIVVLSYKNQEGNTTQEETHFAWTAIYRKYDDEWKIESVTSTKKPAMTEE